MTLRSEIITCIPTNSAILHLNEQLFSGSLSHGVAQCDKQTHTVTDISKSSVLGLMPFFTTLPKTTLPSFSLCLYFLKFSPFSWRQCPASKPGCGLVLERQWAMLAFFPAVGFWVDYLPSHVFCWACFTHTIDCRWCSGLSPGDLEGD